MKTLADAVSYYDDETDGILTLMLENKDKQTVKPIDIEKFYEIKKVCDEIIKGFDVINSSRENLANKALEVNYKLFFEALLELDEVDECPACGTLISEAVRNPFAYAKEKIKEYEEIDAIKKHICDFTKKCKTLIDELKILFECNTELIALLRVKDVCLEQVEASDIQRMDDSAKKWQVLAKSIVSVSNEETETQIMEYNINAKKVNEDYNIKVKKLKEEEKAIVTLSTKLSEINKRIQEGESFIAAFDEESQATLSKIESEKKQANYFIKIIDAYKKIIESLYLYVEQLPLLIAQDLEKKIVDYYNIINRGDADFEMLSAIDLPKGNSNKLVLAFKDGSQSDALQVLSEGHIKILGLSILLAKAIKDKLNFIIFDDIVNAIDDEHRNGVADLLTKHEDFQDVQIILSTHGDQFIMKLKDRLGPSKCRKDAVIYKFLPADSLQERGVVVEFSDARTPIEAAKTKYENNELKDSASKCRQAMESISYNLWGKISQTSDGLLSVAMRSPKAQPDLSSIVDALIKKSKKIEGMETIREKLEFIKQSDNWRVLNKGTHFEDEQPEFDRVDVKQVLETLIELDDLIRELTIKERVV